MHGLTGLCLVVQSQSRPAGKSLALFLQGSRRLAAAFEIARQTGENGQSRDKAERALSAKPALVFYVEVSFPCPALSGPVVFP